MKIVKKIFFVCIFLIQVIVGLIIYAYSAHYWSLRVTVLIALVESVVSFWAYERLFKKKQSGKNNLKKHQAIVKKVDFVKNKNNSKTYFR